MTRITETDIARQLASFQEPMSGPELPTPTAPTTAQLVRARAEEEAAEFAAFTKALATFFHCPSMASQAARTLLVVPFKELRHAAQGLNAQAARRGAPLGQPLASAPASGLFKIDTTNHAEHDRELAEGIAEAAKAPAASVRDAHGRFVGKSR